MSPKAFQTFCRYSVPLKSSSVRHWRCQKLPSFLKEWEENGLNAMLWASLYQSWDRWASYLNPVAKCQECLHCKQEHVLNRTHTLPNFNEKNSQLPVESCIVLTRFLNGPCDLSTWSKIKKNAMTDAFFSVRSSFQSFSLRSRSLLTQVWDDLTMLFLLSQITASLLL